MKKIFISSILMVFNCIVITAQTKSMKIITENKQKPNHQKENALGHDIFKALKENNSNQWILLYPTSDEYKSLLELLLTTKSDGLTQQKIDEMIEQRKLEAVAAYSAEYHGYLKQADSLGIKWKDVVFEKFDFEATHPQNLRLKYLNGDIWFKCKQHHFVIEGIEAVEIKQGYRLQAVKGIRQVDDGE